jgi:hypothetical protein
MTTTEQVLIGVLKGNTGRAICDSGDVYGKHWERNQNRDFLN